MRRQGSMAAALRLLTSNERRRLLMLTVINLALAAWEAASVAAVVPFLVALAGQDAHAPRWAAAVLATIASWAPSLAQPLRAAIVFAAFIALKNAFSVGRAALDARWLAGLQARIETDLFRSYLAKDYAFHVLQGSSQLVNNLQIAPSGFRTQMLKPALDLVTETCVCVLVLAMVLAEDPAAATLAIAFVGLAAFAFHRASRAVQERLGHSHAALSAQSTSTTMQAFGGIRDVKLGGVERHFADGFGRIAQGVARIEARQSVLTASPRLVLEAATGVALVMLVAVSPVTASGTLPTTLALLGAACFRLLPSLNRITMNLGMLRYAGWSIDTLSAELPAPAPAQAQAQTAALAPFDVLRLQGVAFAYPGAAPVLHDVTLELRRGTITGLRGPSGAGKSTLAAIVAGLLAADRGALVIDGQVIDTRSDAWRRSTCLVAQGVFLLDASVRTNIAFGTPDSDVDEDRLHAAVRASCLATWVRDLPAGLDTLVGERGARISGGQTQRLGIARAIYRQPRLLIVDETTTSLDPETERAVLSALDALRPRCAILVIAHQDSTLAHCDTVFELRDGRLHASSASPAPAPGQDTRAEEFAT